MWSCGRAAGAIGPFLLSLLALHAGPARAGTHTWDVSEVFSNADGTIQFVELKEAEGGDTEGGVGNGSISSNTKNFAWANGAVANTANKYYLVATPGFAILPGAPTPNAIIAPGSVPFFNPSGDSVSFGPYDTCTFGPIPTNGTLSYDCLTDTSGVNSPTNFAGATGIVTAGITLGHVDTFQDGSLAGWTGGSNPTNYANGGPGGAGDRYLRISASSGLLGTFNKIQWAGNYTAAAVSQLGFDLNNFGPNPVAIRLMLFTPGCDGGAGLCTAWTSTNATPLVASSGWVTATFSLAEPDLTRVLGSDSYATSLANVERLLIRHDDGAPSPPGTFAIVSAALGIDNATALPEPSVVSELVAGAGLLAAVRGRRRGSRR
jgi:hypothetical protein